MKMRLLYIVCFIACLLPVMVLAQQDSTVARKAMKGSSKINSTANELKKSLDANDEEKIAKNYEKLAEGFIDKGDNIKAEQYLKRALLSYTRLKRDDDKARVTRNLAKIQESQNKFREAASNYQAASETTKDKGLGRLNANDANRVQSASPSVQNEYVKSNLELLKKEAVSETDRKEEAADLYIQKAENSMKLDDKADAIESYRQAISYAKDKPKKVIELQNQIANVYAADNQFDQAININRQLLSNAQKNGDSDTQIKQLQSLSELFFKKNEPEKAIAALKNAYRLAAENGNTAQVRTSLTALLSYYGKNRKDSESMALYNDFLQRFEQIIAADTSLIDAKTFQVTEDKILQLEKEKGLKDELIARKNTFNYFLIAAVILLAIFFGLISKALFSIKRKNKEIALQSLRREMNPHFIFNSLNSVNQFISQNNELEANKYLSSYSNLMREMMENSNKDFISIANEVSQLKKYLDLEHLRFRDKFDYRIIVDENIDTESTFVPNMILQPHLENAIWHGLRYLENKGILLLQLESDGDNIKVIIDDNGIGLAKSAELKTANQKVHGSRGLTNTKERIDLISDLYKHPIGFSIAEKKGGNGTRVEISFPIIHKID